jgi:hypothetical protein
MDWLRITSRGRSQGSITSILFGPIVIFIGELRQFPTSSVISTIRSQLWH